LKTISQQQKSISAHSKNYFLRAQSPMCHVTVVNKTFHAVNTGNFSVTILLKQQRQRRRQVCKFALHVASCI